MQTQNTYTAGPEFGTTLLTIICDAGIFKLLVDSADAPRLHNYLWTARRNHHTNSVWFQSAKRIKGKHLVLSQFLGKVWGKRIHVRGAATDFRRVTLAAA